MLVETINIMRDLSRLHDITSILIRYGGGDMVRLMGLSGLLESAGRMLHWHEHTEIQHLEPAVRARRALEELGPTFVKLGQVLSTRVDLFPPNWIDEFEKLHSEVPAVPFESLLPEVEQALGCPPGEIFREVEAEAYAAASIAQVHRAKLPDGTRVALKIRRPGIRPKIEADLRILTHIARLIESEMTEARRFQPTQIVGEFAKSLRRELDFAAEARNVERFGANFANDEIVVVPKVYWEWTSEVMNVQEFIEGVPGTNVKKLEEAGLDRKELASRGADALLKMILIDGFYHADPHPGNAFYLPGNRIALIDCGMVGRLTDLRRNQMVDLLAALSRREEQGITDVLLEWTGDALVDEDKMANDVAGIIFNYDKVPLKDIRIGMLLGELSAVFREHSIAMPADLTLLFKAFITLEGVGRQLDPDFHMIDHLTPFVRRAIFDRYTPSTLAKRSKRGISDILTTLTGMPRDMAKVLRDIRRGKYKIDLDLRRLDTFGRQLDRTIDRITVGIMTASVVIGSSIVMTISGGPKIFGMPLLTILGLLGFLMAFFNSVWIIFSIWRSNKE